MKDSRHYHEMRWNVKIAVQVGTSWPEDLDVSTDKPTLDSKVKVMIITSITGVAILQLKAFTTYDWLFSEEVKTC